MNDYITHDPIEILSGQSNKIHPLYLETAKNIEKDDDKSLNYLKKFISSIESIASKSNVKDERISSTKGCINKFKGYNDIKSSIEFLSKTLSGLGLVKDLTTIFNCLEKYQTQYSEGYGKNIKLITLEYESALYMLVTGLVFAHVNYLEIKQTGTKINIAKRNGAENSVIIKITNDLSKQLMSKDHQNYLNEIIEARINSSGSKTESVDIITEEAAFLSTFNLIKNIATGVVHVGKFVKRGFQSIKSTVFGILPLIRSILYLRYKKKADTILNLEDQVHFIQLNIEQLKNIKTMDETKKADIIKKQQAVIETMRKKSEKLRAQLIENESDVENAMKEANSEIRKPSTSDDDFVID